MRSSLSRLTYQAVHTGAFLGLRVASSLLIVYLLARSLEPAEFGVYALIRGLVTLGVYVLGLELYTYAQRHVPGTSVPDGLRLFVRVFSWEMAAATLVVGAAVVFGADRLLVRVLNIEGYLGAYRLGLAILLASLAGREFFRFFLAIRMIERSNVITFLGANLWVFAVAALWAWGWRIGLQGVLGLWLGSACLAIGYAGFALARVVGLRAAWRGCLDGLRAASPGRAGEVLAFTLPVFASTVALRLIGVADVYLLSFFHRPDLVGVYAFYSSVVGFGVVVFVLVVSDVLIPYATASFNRGAEELGWRMIAGMTKYSVVIYVPLAAGVAVLMDGILEVIGRPEYRAGEGLLPILLLGGLLNVLFLMMNYVLFIRRRTAAMAAVAAAGALVNVVANAALVPGLGVEGAALSNALSWSVLVVLAAWQVGAEGLRRMALHDLLRVALAAGLGAAVVAAAARLAGTGGPGWSGPGYVSLFVLAYGVGLALARAIRWREVATLKAAVG